MTNRPETFNLYSKNPTGIIPTQRGKGIAKGMFEFALPGLKEQGVNKFLPEVLRPNEAAIKAYRKTGFQVFKVFLSNVPLNISNCH